MQIQIQTMKHNRAMEVMSLCVFQTMAELLTFTSHLHFRKSDAPIGFIWQSGINSALLLSTILSLVGKWSYTLPVVSPVWAGMIWLMRDGVLATEGVSCGDWVVEAVEASSSVLSSSVSEGTMLMFRPVDLVKTSKGTADASAGAFTTHREDCWVGLVLQ